MHLTSTPRPPEPTSHSPENLTSRHHSAEQVTAVPQDRSRADPQAEVAACCQHSSKVPAASGHRTTALKEAGPPPAGTAPHDAPDPGASDRCHHRDVARRLIAAGRSVTSLRSVVADSQWVGAGGMQPVSG